MAFDPEDPNPGSPGQYLGYAEPSFAWLPNGQIICAMRTQYSHLPGKYRPIHISWSDDMGKSWTKPVETNPHLMNICPELAVLDNGVLACQYGRSGFYVVFSLDDGHTWQDRISFSHLPCGVITGQFDMIKFGPNQLLAVGNDSDGTKVWPLTIDRVKVPTTHGDLHGRVLDEQGNPIANATIERSPNRYTADDWLEDSTNTGPWYHTHPLTAGSPKLSYPSFHKNNGYPTVQTDTQGHFRFTSVKLGEYVLTVEYDGHAPQHRHIKIDVESKSHDFRLTVGQRVCNQVVDDTDHPVPGACVVLNRWHTHTDSNGFFYWSVQAPLPEHVEVKVYRRYSSQYETLETTATLSHLESQVITLNRR